MNSPIMRSEGTVKSKAGEEPPRPHPSSSTAKVGAGEHTDDTRVAATKDSMAEMDLSDGDGQGGLVASAKKQTQDVPHAQDIPDLTSVIMYALPMLPSTQAVKYFTTCKAWHQIGQEVLPSILAKELQPLLPRRLVRMMNKSEHSRSHWTEFARQWRQKEFVRANVGKSAVERNAVTCEATGETDKNDDDSTPRKCSACGEISDNLKRCTGCKSVWYCNVTCQKAHRKGHKKECRRIGKEKKDIERRIAQEVKHCKAIEPFTEGRMLETFFSRPDIAECLADTTSPEEYVKFLESLNCHSFHTLAMGFGGGMSECSKDVATEDWPNYQVLTEGGYDGKTSGNRIRKEKFDYFVDQVQRCAPGVNHYFMLEITYAGGQPLALEDGTPLAIWTDGIGRPFVVPLPSRYKYHKKNKDIVEEVKHVECSCPDCGGCAEMEVQYRDDMAIDSDLLLADPLLGSRLCGYEKGGYGRTVITQEQFWPRLLMPSNRPGTSNVPSPIGLDYFFEVTLKLVHYDGVRGPSVVTVYHRDKLHVVEIDQVAGDDDNATGAMKYTFQNVHYNTSAPEGPRARNLQHESDTVTSDQPRLGIEVNVKNVVNLYDDVLEKCKFECDPRPRDDQMWLKDWQSQCFVVRYGGEDGVAGEDLPRSELFRACGLLEGF